MVFSDTTLEQGIVEQIRFGANASSQDFSTNDITRVVNMALDRYFTIATNANNSWEIDDTTYSTHSIGTTNLVSGQTDYSMPAGLIDIMTVELKNQSGDWRTLKPIDILEVNAPLEELYETSGDPIYYDKKGNSIFIFPAPNYNSTLGLKIKYTRRANYFIPTDTTKKPGIPEIHHPYIVNFGITEYKMAKYPQDARIYENARIQWEDSIKKYWSKRGKDKQIGIRINYESPE